MSEFIRNGIAALAVTLTLGGGGLKFYGDFLTLQKQVADLSQTVDAIYCKLDPQSIACVYKSARRE